MLHRPALPALAAVALIPSLAGQGTAPGPDESLRARVAQRVAEQAKQRCEQVRLGLLQAREHGKPVLVLVVPEARFFDRDDALVARNLIVSSLLLEGDVDARCDLALLRPVCAKASELTEVAGIPSVSGQPTALLLDLPADPGGTTKVTALEFDSQGDAAAEQLTLDDTGITPARRARQLELLASKRAELGRTLHRALATHGVDQAALAQRVAKRLAAAQREQIAAWLAGGPPPDDALLVRAAPWILDLAAARPTQQRDALRAAVAQAFTADVVAQPPPGARWTGDALSAECLRLSIPALCSRYLQFHLPL